MLNMLTNNLESKCVDIQEKLFSGLKNYELSSQLIGQIKAARFTEFFAT